MSPVTILVVSTLGLVIGSAFGGSLPLRRASIRSMPYFLAFSAGVMLGVLGTHLLPEAFEVGPSAAWAVVGGFLFMLIIERFVLPHALHAPHEAEAHVDCDPELEAEHVRAEAAGLGAFLGLALHTLSDGIALGATVEDPHTAFWVFAAILAHKVPSAFALGSLLVRAKVQPPRVLAATSALGLVVGLGAVLFLVAREGLGIDPTVAVPYAVGFSAGSFLHVAVTDLLPDLHRARPVKWRQVAALLGGLGLMIALRVLFGHEHE